jgi:hypothetical protein
MRTTIRIGDDLYRRAKAHAARTGRSVGEFIEDAVRDALEPSARPAGTLPELPAFGGTGLMPGIDLSSHASLLDILDEEDVRLDAHR